MILAAGLGTRMKELTKEIPKPLLEIGGVPIIRYSINLLLNNNINNIALNTYYKSEKLKEYINSLNLDINWCIKDEEVLLDTGGGVKNAQMCFNNNPFVLINGDIITDFPLSFLRDIYDEESPIAIMVIKDYEKGYSPVWTEDGRLLGFGDNFNKGEKAVFTGIHFLSPKIFDYLPTGKSSIMSEFYMKALKNGEKILTIKYDGLWLDLGTKERFLSMKEKIEKGKIFIPSYLSEGKIS